MNENYIFLGRQFKGTVQKDDKKNVFKSKAQGKSTPVDKRVDN